MLSARFLLVSSNCSPNNKRDLSIKLSGGHLRNVSTSWASATTGTLPVAMVGDAGLGGGCLAELS